MNEPSATDPMWDELINVNDSLARLFHTSPLELMTGSAAAMSDPLVVCGILGGKDVGKSTLINALAQTHVSTDTDEVGAGTDRPIAYVHREAIALLQQRFADGRADSLPFGPAIHEVDAIRHVVLVDLPDFDSEFPTHVDVVRQVAPRLDRVIWVMTARKIADREWVAFAREVIKDLGNVHCVLNKSDELLGDQVDWVGSDAMQHADHFCQAQREWAAAVLAEAGWTVSPGEPLLVAAAFPEPEIFADRVGWAWNDEQWGEHAADRETVLEIGRRVSDDLGSLRSKVLSAVDESDAASLKQANRAAELRAQIRRIRRHYDLDNRRRQLAAVCDPSGWQQALDEAFGPSFVETVSRHLEERRRGDAELADRLMDARVEQWPLLRVVYWPLSWIVRRLGQTLAPARPAPGGDAQGVVGNDLVERIEAVTLQVRRDHAMAVRVFGLQDDFAQPNELGDRVEGALTRVADDLDDRLLAEGESTYRRPGRMRRSLLWLALLWFPFVQPVAEGFLGIVGGGGMTGVLNGLYTVVRALGASQLLKGFAVVVALYVTCLAVIYARCVRFVRTSRSAEADTTGRAIREHVERVLVDNVAVPLSRPFTHVATTLDSLTERMARIESSQ